MTRYSQKLLEHFNSPRNSGALEDADGTGKASLDGTQPYVSVYIKVADDVLTRVTFQAMGCGATIASGSVLTELATGRTTEQCLTMSEQEVIDALDGLPADRRFCAVVPLRALKAAVVDYLIEKKKTQE